MRTYLWIVVCGGLVLGCAAVSQTTRTGSVHDITITESLSAQDLVVNAGDEIRWVNSRTLPVRIDLINVKGETVSCERGFSNFVGMHREFATVRPNETVSICFSEPGAIRYNVRMKSALPGGEKVLSGYVRVGGAS